MNIESAHFRLSAVLTFGALLSLSMASLAMADPQPEPQPQPGEILKPEDALNFAAGAGIRYEDNLFRLTDSADTDLLPGQPHRTDFCITLLRHQDRQALCPATLQAGLTATENRFQNTASSITPALIQCGMDMAFDAAYQWCVTG